MDSITAYHYTNESALRAMHSGDVYGKGLRPLYWFAIPGRYRDDMLSSNIADGAIIQALLEPEPTRWLYNEEFPDIWIDTIHDVCKERITYLVSFDVTRDDEAYVIDRAPIERGLYAKLNGQPEPTKEEYSKIYQHCYDTRIHALDYRGEHEVPLLAIWSTISFDRLRREWKKSSKEVQERAKQQRLKQRLLNKYKL